MGAARKARTKNKTRREFENSLRTFARALRSARSSIEKRNLRRSPFDQPGLREKKHAKRWPTRQGPRACEENFFENCLRVLASLSRLARAARPISHTTS